ncbi:hypothetical protein V8C44DRAFT_340350 [Trichoderma aethiopicum]
MGGHLGGIGSISISDLGHRQALYTTTTEDGFFFCTHLASHLIGRRIIPCPTHHNRRQVGTSRPRHQHRHKPPAIPASAALQSKQAVLTGREPITSHVHTVRRQAKARGSQSPPFVCAECRNTLELLLHGQSGRCVQRAWCRLQRLRLPVGKRGREGGRPLMRPHAAVLHRLKMKLTGPRFLDSGEWTVCNGVADSFWPCTAS